MDFFARYVSVFSLFLCLLSACQNKQQATIAQNEEIEESLDEPYPGNENEEEELSAENEKKGKRPQVIQIPNTNNH